MMATEIKSNDNSNILHFLLKKKQIVARAWNKQKKTKKNV